MQGDEAKEGAGSAGADRLGELQARVERLGNLFTQLEGARAAARRTRVGITILLLIVAVGYGLVLLRTVTQVREPAYQAKLMEALGEKAEPLLVQTSKDLQAVFEKVAPLYLEELNKQAKDAWPEAQAKLQAEALTFQGSATDKLERTLSGALADLAKRQEKRVRDTFDIQSEADLTNIIKNLDKALAVATANVLDKKFDKSQKRYVEITEKVTRLLPEDRRDTFMQLSGRMWNNLLLDQLKGLDFLTPLTTGDST